MRSLAEYADTTNIGKDRFINTTLPNSRVLMFQEDIVKYFKASDLHRHVKKCPGRHLLEPGAMEMLSVDASG